MHQASGCCSPGWPEMLAVLGLTSRLFVVPALEGGCEKNWVNSVIPRKRQCDHWAIPILVLSLFLNQCVQCPVRRVAAWGQFIATGVSGQQAAFLVLAWPLPAKTRTLRLHVKERQEGLTCSNSCPQADEAFRAVPQTLLCASSVGPEDSHQILSLRNFAGW